jgi:hypothetical protein
MNLASVHGPAHGTITNKEDPMWFSCRCYRLHIPPPYLSARKATSLPSLLNFPCAVRKVEVLPVLISEGMMDGVCSDDSKLRRLLF